MCSLFDGGAAVFQRVSYSKIIHILFRSSFLSFQLLSSIIMSLIIAFEAMPLMIVFVFGVITKRREQSVPERSKVCLPREVERPMRS